MTTDADRLNWLEAALRPLPWGGVYATLESDGDSQFRITLQPSSGDAPFINETGADLRDVIDAAMIQQDGAA